VSPPGRNCPLSTIPSRACRAQGKSPRGGFTAPRGLCLNVARPAESWRQRHSELIETLGKGLYLGSGRVTLLSVWVRYTFLGGAEMSKPTLPTLCVLLTVGVIILGLTLYPPWCYTLRRWLFEWFRIGLCLAVMTGAAYLVRCSPLARWVQRPKILSLVFLSLGFVFYLLIKVLGVQWHKTLVIGILVMIFLSMGCLFYYFIDLFIRDRRAQADDRIKNELRARLGREPTGEEIVAEFLRQYPNSQP